MITLNAGFKLILSCFYFFLPAYLNNMTPPFAKKAGVLKSLDKPVDFNMSFGGERILGSHKTWRGVLTGLMIGFLTLYLQVWLYRFPLVQELAFFDYQRINFLRFGFLLCGGAIFGDLLFAFFKRRLKLKPGAKFIPFDQINHVIGAAIFMTPFYKIDTLIWLTLLPLSFVLHLAANQIGFYLKLNKTGW